MSFYPNKQFILQLYQILTNIFILKLRYYFTYFQRKVGFLFYKRYIIQQRIFIE